MPTSTLRRLLSSPVVREKLGIEASDGELRRVADESKVAKALIYVVNDLASGKTKVKDVYTKEQRTAYANKLPKGVVATPTMPSGKGSRSAPPPQLRLAEENRGRGGRLATS